MIKNYLTPDQKLILFFHLKLRVPIQEKMELHLKLCKEFGSQIRKRTFRQGPPYSVLNRTASFVCQVPVDILGRKKRLIIPSLGSYKVFADNRNVKNEELPTVEIIDNYTYFEKETVPYVLERLGFTVTIIGGSGEPDIIAYHKRINPQKIDVEPTLTHTYSIEDFDEDMGKYRRYKLRYNFKRFLAVCEARSISRNVIEELNKIRDPVSLVEFKDLFNLQLKTKTRPEQLVAYTKLTTTGKIDVPEMNEIPVLFRTTKFNVRREL